MTVKFLTNHETATYLPTEPYLIRVFTTQGCMAVTKHTCFFYKHVKIQGLGSDMLMATQNSGWKYAHDVLILGVKIFKMGAKRLFWSIHLLCLFWSSRPEVLLQIGIPAKLPKSLKNSCEGVHFLVKMYAEDWNPVTLLKMTEAQSEPCYTFKMKFFVKIFNGYKTLINFGKSFILDVWHGSEYASEWDLKQEKKGTTIFQAGNYA